MLQPAPQEDANARDRDTVRRILERDASGLEQLLRDYGGRVRWTLRRDLRTIGEAEVEEALNSAAHRVWRAIDSFDPARGTLRAWFYVITRNVALTILQREAREQRTLDPSDLEELGAARQTDEAVRSEPVFSRHLRACIAQLPPMQRRIIDADLQSGDIVNAAELAQELSTTRNSVYAQRSMAKKALKRCLESKGVFADAPEPKATETTPMTDPYDEFWGQLRARYDRERRGDSMSLEEAEQRLATADDDPLDDAEIRAILEHATGRRETARARSWRRAPRWAAAAGLLLLPVLGLAFWSMWDQAGSVTDSPTFTMTFDQAVRDAADPDLAADLRLNAAGVVHGGLKDGLRALQALRDQGGVLAEDAVAHLATLTKDLEQTAPSMPPATPEAFTGRVGEWTPQIEDPTGDPQTRRRQLTTMVDALRAGVAALQDGANEPDGLLAENTRLWLATLRAAVRR